MSELPSNRYGTELPALKDVKTNNSAGLQRSVVAWDFSVPEFGLLDPKKQLRQLGSVQMAAMAINAEHIAPSGFDTYVGTCAGFSMQAVVANPNILMVVMIMSGGNNLTAQAQTDLGLFGMLNTTLLVGDTLAFAGRLGTVRGAAHEIKKIAATSGSIVTAVQIVGKWIVGPEYRSL
jgi:hypothetical protein